MDTLSSDRWMNKAAAFELLSLAFLVPQRSTADALVSGDFAAACREVMVNLQCNDEVIASVSSYLQKFEGMGSQEAHQAIRCEYTRLFVGMFEPLITPYVGVWAARQKGRKGYLFVGQETVEIERFMRRCGITKDLSAGQANDPLDHIGTLFEFLKYLCLVHAQAVKVPQSAVVEQGDFGEFYNKYLSCFLHWFPEEVSCSTKCAFYKAMAQVASSICEHE